MGAIVKVNESENRQRMKMKVSRQSQLLRSVSVHVASAFICTLVCSYSYWFPWLYCLTNHFMWIYLPTVWPLVFGPKYMFFVANVIILVVVGDWRQACAKSKSTHQDTYEEYVRRSRRPRRVLVSKKVERKADDSTKKCYAKALMIKRKEIVEKKEDIAEEFHESKGDIIQHDVTTPKEIVTMIEVTSVSNSEEKQAQLEEQFEDHSISSAENTTASHNYDGAAAHAHHECIKNARSADNGQNNYVKKAEEIRSIDDDLNKRVEDFITRVNKRRWAEANNWMI